MLDFSPVEAMSTGGAGVAGYRSCINFYPDRFCIVGVM